MDITSYIAGKKAGGGGGGYVLPPATSSKLGGVKVGDGISVTNDGTISVSGGSSTEPTILSVDSITEAFLIAISPLCTLPEVPISSGGAWQALPHLDIDSATYPDIYEACCTMFRNLEEGKITKDIYLQYQGHFVKWETTLYGTYPVIIVNVNDYVFAIYPHDDDIGQTEFTHPFYMVCTAVQADGTLYPYYVMDFKEESVEDSHTGSVGQHNIYTYHVDFTGFDAEEVTHVTVLYYNLLEVLNAYGLAYSPTGNLYRGNELKNFLFYMRTPHFTRPIPVYIQIFSDYSSHYKMEFSSIQQISDAIYGAIEITSTGEITSFEYTEEFDDDRQL